MRHGRPLSYTDFTIMSFRILIPDELPYSSGVENVAVSIVCEWLLKVESVTWIVRDAERETELKSRLGNPGNLYFENFSKNRPAVANAGGNVLGMIKAAVKQLPLLRRGAEATYRRVLDARIMEVARDTGATHCWFHFVQGQSVPDLSIPVCGLVHDQNFRFFPENLPAGKSGQFERALRQWLEKADMMTVLSEAGRLEMLELNPKPGPRIEIIPNAITPNLFAVANNRAPAADPLFFYPAAALSHKNHLLLFQAARILGKSGRPFKIVICGKDTRQLLGNQPIENEGAEEARSYFQQNREILSGRIEALGHCSMKVVEQFYSECWAVVLPSRYEGFGLPLVESLARSVPVLCTRLVPFQEQLERYRAQEWVDCFSPDQPDELAALLEKAIANPPSQRPPAFPMENLQHWTWQDVAERYLTLFDELSRHNGVMERAS